MPDANDDWIILRVADRFCCGDYDRAEAMKIDAPTRFNRLLTLAEVEAAAEPHSYKYAEKKAEEERKHAEKTEEGKKMRRSHRV